MQPALSPELCWRQVREGEQLEISYGALSNDFLLLDYGFLVAGNPHDRVSLRFGFELMQVIFVACALSSCCCPGTGGACTHLVGQPPACVHSGKHRMQAAGLCAVHCDGAAGGRGQVKGRAQPLHMGHLGAVQAAKMEVRQVAGLDASSLQELPPWQAQRLGQLFTGAQLRLGRPPCCLLAWPVHTQLAAAADAARPWTAERSVGAPFKSSSAPTCSRRMPSQAGSQAP